MLPTRAQIESVIGFKTVSWPGEYITACTHKSAVGYYDLTVSYERLEYLGDAVINFVIGSWLYTNFPHADEGVLTQLRTRLVSGETLAKLAGRLGLDALVIMSPRATKFGTSTKVLEDVFESLVGAIYVDSGMLAAKTFVLQAVGSFISLQELLVNKNFKDQLMQWCHKCKVPLPTYVVRPQQGRGFVVQAAAGGHAAWGSGDTKKAAEQNAAMHVLYSLNVSGVQGYDFQHHAAPGHA